MESSGKKRAENRARLARALYAEAKARVEKVRKESGVYSGTIGGRQDAKIPGEPLYETRYKVIKELWIRKVKLRTAVDSSLPDDVKARIRQEILGIDLEIETILELRRIEC